MDKSQEIKANLHQLIDKIDNPELLEMVYQLLDTKGAENKVDLINKLTDSEKRELYQSYEESLNESNLLDLEAIKDKHAKWREK